MPFLPVVLLIAWQALSRSASFALGWATSLYFGQVPGRQGRILSVISLIAAAWVVLIFGFAIPILGGALLEATGVIEENFDVQPLHYAGLVAGLILGPPAIAGCVVWGGFFEERSIGRALRLVPISYPASFMLGISVLQMVVVTPVVLFLRWRHKRKLVDLSLVMREGTDDDDLLEAVHGALESIGLTDMHTTESTGPKSWPLRTMGFAAEHLLGAVVRGEPVRVEVDGVELNAFATNISIMGPKEDVYRIRAALERELVFHDAYLTWDEVSQDFEDQLLAIHRDGASPDAARKKLDAVQGKIDTASINTEQWNLLYRLRLQIERELSGKGDGSGRPKRGSRQKERARS